MDSYGHPDGPDYVMKFSTGSFVVVLLCVSFHSARPVCGSSETFDPGGKCEKLV